VSETETRRDESADDTEDGLQQRIVSLPLYVKVTVAYSLKLAFEKHGVNQDLSFTLVYATPRCSALLCSACGLPAAFEWKRPMKSTRFATACYILSFVSYHGPDMIATQTIAGWVNVNASRVRQIVARLVRAGLLASTRGGEGGVVLGRHASTISLLDIFDAVAEHEVELFAVDNPFSAWQDRCRVHSVLTTMQTELARDFRTRLAETQLSALHARPKAAQVAATSANSDDRSTQAISKRAPPAKPVKD
jgi:DNA-binding IscR family transcriptional regulator